MLWLPSRSAYDSIRKKTSKIIKILINFLLERNVDKRTAFFSAILIASF